MFNSFARAFFTSRGCIFLEMKSFSKVEKVLYFMFPPNFFGRSIMNCFFESFLIGKMTYSRKAKTPFLGFPATHSALFIFLFSVFSSSRGS